MDAQVAFLNTELENRVFIAGMSLTVADLMWWAMLRPVLVSANVRRFLAALQQRNGAKNAGVHAVLHCTPYSKTRRPTTHLIYSGHRVWTRGLAVIRRRRYD